MGGRDKHPVRQQATGVSRHENQAHPAGTRSHSGVFVLEGRSAVDASLGVSQPLKADGSAPSSGHPLSSPQSDLRAPRSALAPLCSRSLSSSTVSSATAASSLLPLCVCALDRQGLTEIEKSVWFQLVRLFKGVGHHNRQLIPDWTGWFLVDCGAVEVECDFWHSLSHV